MASRLKLQELLSNIIDITEPNGDRHVYYNSPESVKMKYPAIKYTRKPPGIKHADNAIYKRMDAYELTLIEDEADSQFVDDLLQLPYCSYDRFYRADGLNHHVFTLYF